MGVLFKLQGGVLNSKYDAVPGGCQGYGNGTSGVTVIGEKCVDWESSVGWS